MCHQNQYMTVIMGFIINSNFDTQRKWLPLLLMTAWPVLMAMSLIKGAGVELFRRDFTEK